MDQLPRFRKTRLAPTPSGFLHLGNALSFLTTAALAKKTGARILLRIDDLDRQRVQKEYVQDIFDTLHYLGIRWEEGPQDFAEYAHTYAQHHRLELYRNVLEQLRAGGHLFACTCSRTQVLQQSPDGTYPGTCRNRNLPLDTAGASWRLRTSPDTELKIKDPGGTVTTARLPPGMQSFVVRKKDGFPAYQLTSLADDVHFGVDLIVRGADLWPSTLAQLYLATLLAQPAFLQAAFHHHPLLQDAAGKKLSKSDGAESIRHLRRSGRPPADIHALLARLQHT